MAGGIRVWLVEVRGSICMVGVVVCVVKWRCKEKGSSVGGRERWQFAGELLGGV